MFAGLASRGHVDPGSVRLKDTEIGRKSLSEEVDGAVGEVWMEAGLHAVELGSDVSGRWAVEKLVGNSDADSKDAFVSEGTGG